MATPADVERFAHCARAWQLGRGEDPPGRHDALHRGVQAHRRIAHMLVQARHAHSESRTGLRWSLRVLAAAGAATLVTLHAVFFDPSPLGWVYVATSLVVLNCSAGLLTLALYDQRRAERIRRDIGLEETPGVDGLAAPPVRDPAWGLEGERGAALLANGRTIPVDARDGPTPPSLDERHALRMAARLRLQEVLEPGSAQYGLVAYPDGVFRVDWAAHEAPLRSLLARLREAEAAGRADRDHDTPHRCAACSFRTLCDQALA